MSCPCDEVESKGHKLLLLGFCNDKEVVGETEIRDSIWSVSFFHFFFSWYCSSIIALVTWALIWKNRR